MTATGGSAMHATSPTKAGESHTITLVMYSCSLSWNYSQDCVENIPLSFKIPLHSEYMTYFLHSKSKNNACEKNF